jgi:pimeloyl-ACP methyl ester carboxylesterase
MAALLPATTLEQVWDLRQALDRHHGVPLPPPELQEFLHRRFVANDPVGLRTKADILLTEPDRVEALAATAAAARLRVAVVTGEDDDVWSPQEQATMARRLGVTPITLSGAAHSPAVEQSAATAAVLDQFWRTAG